MKKCILIVPLQGWHSHHMDINTSKACKIANNGNGNCVLQLVGHIFSNIYTFWYSRLLLLLSVSKSELGILFVRIPPAEHIPVTACLPKQTKALQSCRSSYAAVSTWTVKKPSLRPSQAYTTRIQNSKHFMSITVTSQGHFDLPQNYSCEADSSYTSQQISRVEAEVHYQCSAQTDSGFCLCTGHRASLILIFHLRVALPSTLFPSYFRTPFPHAW